MGGQIRKRTQPELILKVFSSHTKLCETHLVLISSLLHIFCFDISTDSVIHIFRGIQSSTSTPYYGVYMIKMGMTSKQCSIAGPFSLKLLLVLK